MVNDETLEEDLPRGAIIFMNHATDTIPRTDYHIHSQYSECAEDVTIEKDAEQAQEKGITRIAITDHGSTKTPQWIHDYFRGVEDIRKKAQVDILTGIECDINMEGDPIVSERILEDMDVVIGALHHMPCPRGLAFTSPEFMVIYRRTLSAALKKKWMKVLAHPTDVGWIKLELPPEIVEEIATLAAKNGVALELNYHHKDPTPIILKVFLESGVIITPTSDAHMLHEIGNYHWHESILRRSGFRGTVRWLKV